MKKISVLVKRLFKTKTRIIIVSVILVATGVFGWQSTKKDEPKTEKQTATVERATIISAITASGTVISSNIENITTQASGTIARVYVSDGDEVVVGQKLAEIDLDVQGEQNYLSAYSSYVSAQNSLNSANNGYRLSQASLAVVYDEIKGHDNDESFELKETRTRAEVANDNAYDSVETAKVRLSAAAVSLKTNSPVISSPASGTIKSVSIAEGMNIGAAETASGARANQRIATIGTGGLPIASFSVSEIDVTQIEPGQKAIITLDSIADKTFTGKVVSVDRVGTISSNVATYPAIIQFDTKAEQILPNMTAMAKIIVETKSDILVVPSTAINYQDEAATVQVLRNGQEFKQAVEVGISSDTESEIVSGLSEGEIVVTGRGATAVKESSNASSGLIPIRAPGSGGGIMR